MRHFPDKKRLLELTLAVYKVTAIFPVGEELSQNIREWADKVLLCDEKCSRYISETLELFDLAEKNNWVDPRNFLVLRREYEKILDKNKTADNLVSSRKDKILEMMADNGVARIGDFAKIFPGVNRRTVLRDLDELCQTGVMLRNGHGRGVYYIKNATMSQ